jgi:hypothetical protein
MDSSVNDYEEPQVEVPMLYSQSPLLAEKEWRTALSADQQWDDFVW